MEQGDLMGKILIEKAIITLMIVFLGWILTTMGDDKK